MFRRTAFILFIAYIAAFTGCANKSPAVATIGKQDVIRLDEFKAAFSKGRTEKQLKKSNLAERMKVLNSLIDDRLIGIGAEESGLAEDSVVCAHADDFLHRKLVQLLYEKEIAEKVIHEQDIRDLYARLSREARIRMIFFKRPFDGNKEKLAESLAKANKALDRVRSGEDFAAVAREMSDDPSSRERGGLIKSLTWVRKDDLIRNTVFSMKEGEISDVVEDKQGYFIFKVEEFKHIKQEPYKDAREQLRKQLLSMNRSKLSSMARTYLEALKKEFIVSLNDSAMIAFFNAIKPYNTMDWKARIDSIRALPASIQDMDLAALQNGNVFYVKDAVGWMVKAASPRKGSLSNVKELRAAVDSWLTQEALIKRAVEKGLDKDRDVRQAYETMKQNEMKKRFTDIIMENTEPLSEEYLKKYYTMNRDKKYILPEQVKIQEVMVKDKDLARNIAKRARQGENFNRLVQKYTERTRFKKNNGIIGYFPKGSWGVIGNQAFTMKVGEISDVVSLGKRYSVIKLLDKKAKQIQPYTDVINRVKVDAESDRKQSARQSWLQKKREELGVTVHETLLAKAYN